MTSAEASLVEPRPLSIGAYGVASVNGNAAWNRGQEWLDGTSGDILRRGWTRSDLEVLFPRVRRGVHQAGGEYSFDSGVVHIRRRAGEWLVGCCLEAAYSSRRSIPLWLCVVASEAKDDDLAALADMLLLVVRGASEVSRTRGGLHNWFAGRLEAPLPPRRPIDELRTAAWIWDGRDRDLPIRVGPEGDGGAIAELAPGLGRLLLSISEGSGRGGSGSDAYSGSTLGLEPWCAILLRESDESGSEFRPTFVFRHDDSADPPTDRPMRRRGVEDAEILKNVGLEVATREAVLNSIKSRGRFSEGLPVEIWQIPTEMVSEELLPNEIPRWAESVAARPDRAEGMLQHLPRRVREGDESVLPMLAELLRKLASRQPDAHALRRTIFETVLGGAVDDAS